MAQIAWKQIEQVWFQDDYHLRIVSPASSPRFHFGFRFLVLKMIRDGEELHRLYCLLAEYGELVDMSKIREKQEKENELPTDV